MPANHQPELDVNIYNSVRIAKRRYEHHNLGKPSRYRARVVFFVTLGRSCLILHSRSGRVHCMEYAICRQASQASSKSQLQGIVPLQLLIDSYPNLLDVFL
ncbi:hypothetical protein TWF694_003852 [Orbilia ellipsospora]|uniref:Uncharacterized protein n=1 Tax=Orbilia ellipsospora TaxID=2528407 RepID=A0AAV9X1Z0_9PEZI